MVGGVCGCVGTSARELGRETEKKENKREKNELLNSEISFGRVFKTNERILPGR